MHRRCCSLALGWPLSLGLAAIALITGAQSSQAQDIPPPAQGSAQDSAPTYLRPTNLCPTDLKALTTQLLNDLPSYANRVASRNLDLSHRPVDATSTVLVVGSPDFTPIDLAESAPSDLAQGDLAQIDTATLQQVFFTTLERQYLQNHAASLQNHHWLFLAQTPEGWYMAMLYSSLGNYPAEDSARAPTPPQESSNGIIGQAIRLWLRDCRAGAVFSAETDVDRLPSAGATNP